MKKYSAEELYQLLLQSNDGAVFFGRRERERVLSEPLIAKRVEELIEDGERFRGHRTMEIPFSAFKRFETDGNRTEYEYAEYGYFIRRKKLTTYAVLSWLFGKEDDISELEDVIFAICNEYTWVLPAHLRGTALSRLQTDLHSIDLFAAETGAALAEILSILGDKLSPIITLRVKRELKSRILDIADADFRWNNGAMKNNWVSVCNGCVGIAAVYAEDDTKRLSEILASSINALEYFYASITEDGVCSEGVGYWTYGFGFFTYFADILKRRTDGKIDLFNNEKMRRCAEFFGKCFLAGGTTVDFADMWDERLFVTLPGLSCYLKKVYPDSMLPPLGKLDFTYPESYRARFTRDFREFVWVESDMLQSASEPSGTYIFPVSEWYISTADNGVSIAAKGGHNAEPHNHNDVGSFTFYKNGMRAFADLGASEYVKDYFGEKRYTFFNPSSASHNVPVINGEFQKAGREFKAEKVIITEDGISMDIASAYGVDVLSSLVRTLEFDRTGGVLTVTDKYVFAEAGASVSERFVSPIAPNIENGEVKITDGKTSASLFFDSDVLTPRLSTESFRRHDGSGEYVKVYVIDLEATVNTSEAMFRFIIK